MKYGLIGEHLGHSFSKEIHNKIGDYQYEIKEIAPCDIDEFMKKRDFIGINVTIPYKQVVIPYLDEITDEAKMIGAVNTIVNKDGKLIGHNTDFGGLRELIKLKKIEIKDKKVLILGSGGTSKTAYSVCTYLGARQIYKLSRNTQEGTISYEEAIDKHKDAQVIINTTPCGMYPNIYETPIDIRHFTKLESVVDVIYNPLKTELIQTAEELKLKTAGGLFMLVMQAVLASEFFFDSSIAQNKVMKIYNEQVQNKKNLVFIGMPACGKSTVGKVLAKRMNRELIDADKYLERCYNRKITDIFAKEGEKYFRDLESEVIRQLSAKSGIIIATGGGVILREENMRNLKKNGFICFIDRPLEKLVPTKNRPTASSIEAIKQRYNERYDLYMKYKDMRINAFGNIYEVVRKVYKGFINENFSD